MNAYPPTLSSLIRKLSRLPGLGEKSAARIAMHLVKAPAGETESLAENIRLLRRQYTNLLNLFSFYGRAAFAPFAAIRPEISGKFA